MFGFQIKHGQTGQALIEAALALPVLLMLSFLMIDVGTGFFVRNTMNNVARDEARILATDPKLNPNYRPPAGSTQTPQQAVAQAMSDAKTRITVRIAPIAGMGKPLSVSNDGIQILVPGVNGTPGNLTDNPVEVRITRQLNLISANFIPDAAADRIINTSVSASAFVEKGTISGDINLVTEDGRSITTETDLCTEGQICTCETNRALCTPAELCTIRLEIASCNPQQKCDLFGECTCATKASLCNCTNDASKCTPEELCTVRKNARQCCITYGGADGTGINPSTGKAACSESYRCDIYGLKTDECCKLSWTYCEGGGDYCKVFTNAAEQNPAFEWHKNYYCCISNSDKLTYPANSPNNPYCCAYNPAICYSNSQKCLLQNDIQACCLLSVGESGAEKCSCKNDINRCDSGGVCIEHPDSSQCCNQDAAHYEACCTRNVALCKPADICQYHPTSQQCDCQKCAQVGANGSEECCRCNVNSTQCINYRCEEGVYDTKTCCQKRGDTSLVCCQADINQCKPVDVCSVYPDQPKCKVEG